MLSLVLKRKSAIEVNIAIMRAFVELRKMISSHADLERKLASLEKKYDKKFKIVFDAIRALMSPPEKLRNRRSSDLKRRDNCLDKGVFE